MGTRTTATVVGAALALSLGGAAVSQASTSTVAAHAPAAAAKPAPHVDLALKVSSDKLKACYPRAWARVRVNLTTDQVGYDTVTIRARGLRPKTTFTLFFLERPDSPFGAAEYFGDFTTNKWGAATNSYRLIAEEAFAFNNKTKDRTDLNSVGFWFGDEKDDDGCLGVDSPVTGFDGDARAGVQMMNSGTHKLP
jgi:hypothetical protein